MIVNGNEVSFHAFQDHAGGEAIFIPGRILAGSELQQFMTGLNIMRNDPENFDLNALYDEPDERRSH